MNFNVKMPKSVKDVIDLGKKTLSPTAASNFLQNGSDFIYKKNKETAVMLLVLNGLSIIVSHLAQINGLRRNKQRENREYLIKQERAELGLDLALTIIPPFFINKFLSKQLISGRIATESSRVKLGSIVAGTLGLKGNEIYDKYEKFNPKKTINNLINSGRKKILNSEHFSKEFKEKISPKVKSMATEFPSRNFRQKILDFDKMTNCQTKGFVNGSAFDEIHGEINGLLILASLLYTVIASSIIVPIFKNIISNKRYEKYLKKQGKTVEGEIRKKRFEYNKTPVFNTVSSEFSQISNNLGGKNSIYLNNLKNVAKSNINATSPKVFNDFNKTPNTFNDFTKTNFSSLKI